MYRCKSWTIRKAEHWRIEAFELWCWRRLLRILWKVWRSIQSILKKINSEYSLEGLMLKLKLQSFDHLVWRAHTLEKTLMLGKIEGMRKKRRQRMRWCHWLSGQEFEPTLRDGEGQGSLASFSPLICKELVTTEKLNNNINKAGFMPTGIWSYRTLNTTFTKNELSTDFSLLTWNSNSQKQQEPCVEKIRGK